MKRQFIISAILPVFLCGSIISYKLFSLRYPSAGISSDSTWKLTIKMQFEPIDQAMRVRLAIPPNGPTQQVCMERISSPGLRFHISNNSESGNRYGVWAGYRLKGLHSLTYQCSVKLVSSEKQRLYDKIEEVHTWLKSSNSLQVNHQAIQAAGKRLNDYLLLSYSDKPSLIKTEGIKNFSYFVSLQKDETKQVGLLSRLNSKTTLHTPRTSLSSLPLNTQNVAKVLLMVPLGALAVAIFRNIIGIQTFGAFMPLLIALSFQETTVGWGLLFFGVIIGVGILMRKVLDSLKLLMIPRLCILLTIAISITMGLTLIGYDSGMGEVLSAALFPMVIMTMTIERFSIMQAELGSKAALTTALGTAMVSSCAYFLMNWQILQVPLFNFPELLLVLISIFILMGRYTGMRFSELWRFRSLREG